MRGVKKKIDQEKIEILSKPQLAKYFGTSVRTVERMFVDGLDSIKIGGKRYVTRAQLNDFIRRHEQSA